MEKAIRNMFIGLVILMILVPLGLLSTGETFGEWGNEDLEEKIGFIPQGLDDLSSTWSAPIPDYAFPGDESFKGAALAYYISALLGVVICGGLLYVVGKHIASRND
ncbi:MAG: cobalamin biosynthesis protein [Methanotrichaceae archaeon]|nr:cobalamin biosynthesis protein [Methanotrichaceae archaeon]